MSTYNSNLNNYYDNYLSDITFVNQTKPYSSISHTSTNTTANPINETIYKQSTYPTYYQNNNTSNTDSSYYDSIQKASELLLEQELIWYTELINKEYLSKDERIRASQLKTAIIEKGGESKLNQIESEYKEKKTVYQNELGNSYPSSPAVFFLVCLLFFIFCITIYYLTKEKS